MKEWERRLARHAKRRRLLEAQSTRARTQELEDYLRGPRSKLNVPQNYLRDERLFMKLLKKFVPQKQQYMLPSRPGLLIRTGMGVNPFMSLMNDDRIWNASPEAKTAKRAIMQIYNKWKGRDWALEARATEGEGQKWVGLLDKAEDSMNDVSNFIGGSLRWVQSISQMTPNKQKALAELNTAKRAAMQCQDAINNALFHMNRLADKES